MSRLFIGNNAIRLPIVESTNTFAQELLKSRKPAEGTIVVAEQQRQGRGQRGNSWMSETGKNLTFSVLLYPSQLTAENQFLLTQVISLALTDFAMQELSATLPIKIKWPNDIYVGSKKIAGVLIENSWRGNELYAAVIGIGVNINQQDFENKNATSLQNLSTKNYDLETCLEHLCSCIEARYLQLLNKSYSAIKADYLKRLFRINELARYEIAGEIKEGKILGVGSNGKLQLALTENFSVLELGLKEVKFIL